MPSNIEILIFVAYSLLMLLYVEPFVVVKGHSLTFPTQPLIPKVLFALNGANFLDFYSYFNSNPSNFFYSSQYIIEKAYFIY